MRSLRITIALAAIACVVGALASPAFAAKEKEKAFFGEFFANVPSGGPITSSTPVAAKTNEGELGALFVGSEKSGPFSISCEKLTSKATVPWERSENFLTEVKFHKCKAIRRLQGGLEEHVQAKFGKGFEMEFHANGSADVGKSEGETKIIKGTTINIKVKGGVCQVQIPAQTVPTKAAKNPEKEWEAAEYETEEEPTTKLKLYPNGIEDKLDVFWEVKPTFYVPAEAGGACSFSKESGGSYNPELKVAEFKGFFEGELDEISVPKGNIGFETAAEIKEKEV